MPSLTDALKQIEAYSKCDQSFWRPQLSIQDIDVILQNYPFKLTEEVYELYRWHNGTLPIFREDDMTSEIAFDFGYHLAELIGDILFYRLKRQYFGGKPVMITMPVLSHMSHLIYFPSSFVTSGKLSS